MTENHGEFSGTKEVVDFIATFPEQVTLDANEKGLIAFTVFNAQLSDLRAIKDEIVEKAQANNYDVFNLNIASELKSIKVVLMHNDLQIGGL